MITHLLPTYYAPMYSRFYSRLLMEYTHGCPTCPNFFASTSMIPTMRRFAKTHALTLFDQKGGGAGGDAKSSTADVRDDFPPANGTLLVHKITEVLQTLTKTF